MKLKKILFLSAILSLTACSSEEVDLLKYVDPYIGSGGHGHVFVGANVPMGMVQAGPQNIEKGWDWCSGYHYSDSVIIGFSHTHLSGTGCADMGDVLVMPYTGEVRSERGEQDNIENSCSSYYSHADEQVRPGYYSLKMDNGVFAEMTATRRAAMHHYIYPAGETPRLLVNLKEGTRSRTVASSLRKVDDYTIEGYRQTTGWSPHRKVFFVLKTREKIRSLDVFENNDRRGENALEGKEVKGVLSFDGDPEEISFKVALSSVSCENAARNMAAEMKDWNFGQVLASAQRDWNNVLSKIMIDTDDERAKRIFYTGLYHMYMAPTLYADVDGSFRGHDDKIYKADWTNYSTFSLWDTYRAYHPLLTIIDPERVPDMVNSMLSIFDQQGKLPIWPLCGGETECMPGYSAIPVIADAYMKNIKGFDPERALDAMVSSATYRKQVGVPYLLDKGYIPCDKIIEATSKAMEYAVGDWGIARMADKMGRKETAEVFAERGRAYAKYFDQEINFARPKMEDGTWRTPYNPFTSVHNAGDFTEGNGWHYTFFAPQHPEGLIDLMGGDEAFISKLDSLFIVNGDMGEKASADISGLIGMYAHGNEPSHHVAYMYPYAGQQWKTAEKVHYIQKEFYTDDVDGVIGNEDCGQMSAWHVISALGFYQVNPSNGCYVFGTPSFPEARVQLPEGKEFKVIAHELSDENFYIQSVKLNGRPYEKAYITYEDIMAGSTLEFVMGPQPQKNFGAAPENRPVSR